MKIGSDSEPLVSVIVPIYNVERYVRPCIQSILDQTHKNLEVILVNDGSPDSSGLIVDEFATRDCRVVPIHQSNAGVSAARNAALDVATGEYVCFVDADDWLAPSFVEVMLGLAKQHDADYVVSRHVLKSPCAPTLTKFATRLWKPQEATKELLYAEIIVGSWNKLYRRSLIEKSGLRFLPQYFMGEGLNFITAFAQVSNLIVATDLSLYYYRRDNQESATTKISVRKMENALAAIDNIESNLLIKSEDVSTALRFHRIWTGLYTLSAITYEGRKNWPELWRSVYSYVREHTLSTLLRAEIPLRRKVLLASAAISPSLSLWLMKLKSRR